MVNPVLCTCAEHARARVCTAYSEVCTKTILTEYYINTHSREMHVDRPTGRKQVGRGVTKCADGHTPAGQH